MNNNIIKVTLAIVVGLIMGLGYGLALGLDAAAQGSVLRLEAAKAQAKAHKVQVHINLQPVVKQRMDDALYLSVVWGTPATKVDPKVYASIERQLVERCATWHADAATWDGKGFGIDHVTVEGDVVVGAYVASGKAY